VKSLKGLRILIIGIGFYDYEDAIVGLLTKYGANVVSYTDQPNLLSFGLLTPILKRVEVLKKLLIKHHEKKILDYCSRINFDKVLIIKGTGLSLGFIRELRSKQKNSEFILYQWDSLARLPGIQEKFPFFDRLLTFDRLDTLKNAELTFRPLFYRSEILKNSLTLSIDIAFIGWLHADRLKAMNKLELMAKNNGLTYYIYLYTGFLTWFRLFLKGQANNVHFLSLNYKRLQDINSKSRVIYDVPHQEQSGLTMRVIEALGARKKIVTTSLDIVNYNFYSKNNIHIIDLLEPNISINFINGAADYHNDDILYKYSLECWLADVFNVKINHRI
jgi:hypothetical protein